MRKPGTIEPIVYFVNHADPNHPVGYIILAPYSECPAPNGYQKEGVDTLSGVDRLEKILVDQERRDWEREAEYNEKLIGEKKSEIRDRLYAKMTSSSTDPWEKEFIRLYLYLREEKKQKYQQRYLERTAYLWARHNDTPKGRGVDEEKVSLDRINF
jgi:hypothetical protein